MYSVYPEDTFIRDTDRWSRKIPQIWNEIDAVAAIIIETGKIPEEYDPHFLSDPNLNYAGYFDFHLLDGRLDLVIIYSENNKKKAFRFIRLGTHNELFHEKLK